jgi:VanZ family protein
MVDQRRARDFWKNAVTVGLVAYWITLFVSTHVPIDPNEVLPGSDKTLHFVGYGILGSLLMLAFLVRRNDSRFTALAVPAAMLWVGLWGVIALYAACDELTQPWVGRHCDVLDWRADITGSAIGLTVAWVIWKAATACCEGAGKSGADSRN